MYKSLETLKKILVFEGQNRFQNKAIIGGMEKFFPNWLAEAKKEAVPEDILLPLENFLPRYSILNAEERAVESARIIDLIKQYETGNSVTAKTLPGFRPPARESERASAINSHPPTETTSVSIEPAKSINTGLNASVNVLQGIGDVKKEIYQSIGINKVEDLLYYFPRRYVDYSTLKTINRLEFGDELTIIATVQSFLTTPIRRRNQARVEVVVSDGTGFLRLVFFRSLKYIQSFENHFRSGTQLVISGKVSMYLGRKQMNDPAFEYLDQSHLNTNRITPVYPLTAGLTQKDIRTAVNTVIRYHATKIQDYLTPEIKKSAGLVDLPVALHQVHYPDSFELLRAARDRLAFDEVFFLQLGVQQQKQNWQHFTAEVYPIADDQIDRLLEPLPFSLTNAQRKVIGEIRVDLASGHPMNRLIQGDVGSGKTIVAAIASAAVNINGGQTAFMAPTSILAEQHYRSLCSLLCNSAEKPALLTDGEIRLLTGDTSGQEREEINNGCLDGTIKILIGTHALIEDPVRFKNLQLAIIDEQHRFGITQRSALRQKGENPHLLVMSATPIPRSLALTLFGDLDISIIDEMPAGRKPVDTRIVHPFARENAYSIINQEIQSGHQAFIIYPLIEKGEDEDQKAAVEEHAHLQKEVFPKLKLGLLHGKMPVDQKDNVMQDFRNHQYDILVSTTVIEVGVDIPNATVMLIEGANRFGLAQLHQLRGRVGRGGDAAYCLLIPENEDALENERLAVMTETTDGFLLAEKDLEQRGPGDFIGYRQSGYADLRMASLSDIRLIEKARHFAQEILKSDPTLEKPEHDMIKHKLEILWNVDSSDIS